MMLRKALRPTERFAGMFAELSVPIGDRRLLHLPQGSVPEGPRSALLHKPGEGFVLSVQRGSWTT